MFESIPQYHIRILYSILGGKRFKKRVLKQTPKQTPKQTQKQTPQQTRISKVHFAGAEDLDTAKNDEPKMPEKPRPPESDGGLRDDNGKKIHHVILRLHSKEGLKADKKLVLKEHSTFLIGVPKMGIKFSLVVSITKARIIDFNSGWELILNSNY